MRVLVTGSRTWTNPQPVRDRLALLMAMRISVVDPELTVIHGGAGRGVDAIVSNWCAEHIARGWPIHVERHPAQWRKYRQRAGPIRNAEMVQAGADLCLAFIRDGSPGATGCAEMARKAGIETVVHTWDDTHTEETG